ncbi:MAG: hypothetical protein J5789_04370 [Oscillospiraceae bacterium]|nr:hypothetical protein [Oscillospiraceae bacterium]
MKRLISLSLALVLICSLFAGCIDSANPTEKINPSQSEAEQSKSVTTEPAATEVPLPSLAWTAAFRMKDLTEEGEVASNQIAFMQVDGSGAKTVVNIPKTEVFENQPEQLPRTHFFEQYMAPELIEELLPALDYAMAHGYSRMCIPTTRLSYGAIESASKYLVQTYQINNNKIGSLGIKDVELPDGQTLTFLLVTIGGMENRGLIEQYLEGIDAARSIVAEMPQDLDENGKMLYFYRWLTENVSYYDYDEYAGEYYEANDWCMTYDALVKHSTVCAGYAEALYVLCSLAGIECFTINGEIVRNTDPGMHIWNVAKIDGKYYQFDSTWDAGIPVADYEYYGVSEERMEALRKQYVVAFAKEYCPPCQENLLPAALDFPEEMNAPEFALVWYYRLRNARNTNPLTLFRYFGMDEKTVAPEEPKDGWVKTSVDYTSFYKCLRYVMTDDAAIYFLLGYFVNETEGDPALSYSVPAENAETTRLIGLEQNSDGTWTAQILRFLPDGSFTPDQETVTMQSIKGYWFISNVE